MLKGRLLKIYEKIANCDVLCDIGTDHALLPIELIKNNKCNRVIGSDIHSGPLEVAYKNAKRNKVIDRLELRKGNGLENIDISEIDTVVIAGMGGDMISEILEKDLEKAKRANLIILQAMNSVERLRSFLYKTGFQIIDEELVSCGEKIYSIICVKFDGLDREPTALDLVIGNKILERKDALLKPLLRKKIKIYKNIQKGMEEAIRNGETNLKEELMKTVEVISKLEKELDRNSNFITDCTL